MVLVQRSVAKEVSCAVLGARQRFTWRGSLRRRSRCKPVRSRSTRRAQPLANAKMPESKMAKGQGRAGETRETDASIEPRTGGAAVRLRPGTGQRNRIKKPWGSPPLRTTAAPASSASRRHGELPPHHTNPENAPHALASVRGASAAPHRLRCARIARRRLILCRNRRARAPLHRRRPLRRARGADVQKLAPPGGPPKTPIRVAR